MKIIRKSAGQVPIPHFLPLALIWNRWSGNFRLNIIFFFWLLLCNLTPLAPIGKFAWSVYAGNLFYFIVPACFCWLLSPIISLTIFSCSAMARSYDAVLHQSKLLLSNFIWLNCQSFSKKGKKKKKTTTYCYSLLTQQDVFF